MKGFGIEIKNNLLDPKHVTNMASSVWLYMWLVDHITSVSDKGLGIVLGGKPVKFEEVNKDLGISQDTYTRWMDKLLEYPYIKTIRTPYGICFTVLKAFKRFGKRIRTSAESVRENAESLRDFAESNKTMTIQLDSNSKTLSAAKPHGDKNKSFPAKWYATVADHYQKIKEVKLSQDEFLPIQKECKLIFKNGRQPDDIIRTMEICNDNYEDWTMVTVRMKIADVVSGRLKSKNPVKNKGLVVEGIKDV